MPPDWGHQLHQHENGRRDRATTKAGHFMARQFSWSPARTRLQDRSRFEIRLDLLKPRALPFQIVCWQNRSGAARRRRLRAPGQDQHDYAERGGPNEFTTRHDGFPARSVFSQSGMDGRPSTTRDDFVDPSQMT
jgi:hypothetical protein